MGRRKIEIKAIKDDRNRSVTFLKRKGGLFKKAHELSVLCSVDVAVIIFGHNKKLYEFSSGDINDTIGRYQYVTQYGGAHEHKGPEDFVGKKDGDDEDDDDEEGGAAPRDSHTPPEHGMMPHHLQHAQAYQHIRHATPSASPPMPNGGIPFHQRGPSPQPGHLSRPNSRAHIRRPSSNLAPPQPYPSQAPAPQPNYAYMPNPPFYNPQAAQQMAQRPSPGPPSVPQFQYTHPPSTHAQVQFIQQDQPRQAMPPTLQQQQHAQQQHQQQVQQQVQQAQHQQAAQQQHVQQQQQQQQAQQAQQQQAQQQQQSSQHQSSQQQSSQQQSSQQQSVSQPQQERLPQPTISVPSPPQHDFQSPPLPQPRPLHASAKHSIFTPIDDSQSMLAAHWGSSSNINPLRSDAPFIKQENRSQSIDVAAMSRLQTNGFSPPQPPPTQMPTQAPPQRTPSTSSVPSMQPMSRTNSLQTEPKKPRLRVQIPSEHSDAGSATADSSPKDSGLSGATPARTGTDASHSSGVVLPPPSPSANSLMSAGATGPPNPFARPPPPSNSNSYGSRNDMETPISALPSRFVENGLLPSPSSFYPEWGFGRGDSNMLPSPLTFQTPVVQSGPSFARDDSAERKRKTSDDGSESGHKRVKA